MSAVTPPSEGRSLKMGPKDFADAICERPGQKIVRLYAGQEGQSPALHEEVFLISDQDEFSIVRLTGSGAGGAIRETHESVSPQEAKSAFYRAVNALSQLQLGLLITVRMDREKSFTSVISFMAGCWMTPSHKVACDIVQSITSDRERPDIETPVVPSAHVLISTENH